MVSQSALQYGLRMLEKSGTGLQPSIKTANAYERNLLQEVNFIHSKGCTCILASGLLIQEQSYELQCNRHATIAKMSKCITSRIVQYLMFTSLVLVIARLCDQKNLALALPR